jgi:C4-dicarboxylate transporter DctM subunit
MNAAIIFGILLVLMLTGMPISISLGLTVLSFLFTMTEVPLESVALKLFTGIEKFEIMAIPSSSWPATSSPTAGWPSG